MLTVANHDFLISRLKLYHPAEEDGHQDRRDWSAEYPEMDVCIWFSCHAVGKAPQAFPNLPNLLPEPSRARAALFPTDAIPARDPGPESRRWPRFSALPTELRRATTRSSAGQRVQYLADVRALSTMEGPRIVGCESGDVGGFSTRGQWFRC